MRRHVIGVMGPGRGSRALEDAAFTLGRLIAAAGWILLTGGRRTGVMDAASHGAKTVPGSITVGVLPGGPRGDDVSRHVDIAIFTDMGDARNAINVLSSDIIIACGASTPGTLSEIALALKAEKPVIVLGASDEAKAFLASSHGEHVHLVEDPDAAIARIRGLGITPGSPW
jgi:uncharacterized protein (TIGR00725 family)